VVVATLRGSEAERITPTTGVVEVTYILDTPTATGALPNHIIVEANHVCHASVAS